MPRVSDVSMNSVTFRLSASVHVTRRVVACVAGTGCYDGDVVTVTVTIVLAMLPSLAQCSCKMFRYVLNVAPVDRTTELDCLCFGSILTAGSRKHYPQYATMQNAMTIN